MRDSDRCFTEAEKAATVEQSYAVADSVCGVARRHGLTRCTLADVTASGALATMAPAAKAGATVGEGIAPASSRKQGPFWPNGARLAISFSLMFVCGGQPISDASGAMPEPIKAGIPDQVTELAKGFACMPAPAASPPR